MCACFAGALLKQDVHTVLVNQETHDSSSWRMVYPQQRRRMLQFGHRLGQFPGQ